MMDQFFSRKGCNSDFDTVHRRPHEPHFFFIKSPESPCWNTSIGILKKIKRKNYLVVGFELKYIQTK